MPTPNAGAFGRKKGFISSPLIGTVVFLAAIVFIVNLQNVEAQSSLRIANDAYHNRVTSVLEEYRSDLASIFREGLSRTISYYLLSQGWSEFKLSNDPTGRYRNPANPLNDLPIKGVISHDPNHVQVEDLRYAKCESIKALTSDVICSIGGGDKTGATQYGLSSWMKNFLNPFTFEGITFSTTNPKQVEAYLPSERLNENPPPTDPYGDYEKYCNLLLQGSIFDCNSFATATDATPPADKFKCIDKNPNDENPSVLGYEDQPAKWKQVDGCGAGTFFVKVEVQNEGYQNIPRVQADDGSGNVIVSSGISENDFYLPINLRLFEYYDEIFKVYNRLAYGQQNINPAFYGVANGHCGSSLAGSCSGAQFSPFPQLTTGYTVSATDTAGVKKAVKDTFVQNVFMKACSSSQNQFFPGRQDVELRACPVSGCTIPASGASGVLCSDNNPASPPDASAVESSLDDPDSKSCGASGTASCAAYVLFQPTFVLVDKNPAFRIDPNNPVFFQWSVGIQYAP